jgi:hypothetical protein
MAMPWLLPSTRNTANQAAGLCPEGFDYHALAVSTDEGVVVIETPGSVLNGADLIERASELGCWLSRKEARPKTTAMDLATEMGVALLTEEEYLALQKLGEFDTKTSSWIATPADFREQGGALWGGRSYGRVFIGCNGAQSYYAARGFRGVLKV